MQTARGAVGILHTQAGCPHRPAGGRGHPLFYMWQDRSIEFHTCKVCHCTTHWAPADKTHDRMAVNARLMAPDVLAAADVHKNDGASW